MHGTSSALPTARWLRRVVCLAALVSGPALALAGETAVYRCSEGGTVALSQFPCEGGQRQPVRQDRRTEAQLHDALSRQARDHEALLRTEAARRRQAERDAVASRTASSTAAPGATQRTPASQSRRSHRTQDPRLFTARGPRPAPTGASSPDSGAGR